PLDRQQTFLTWPGEHSASWAASPLARYHRLRSEQIQRNEALRRPKGGARRELNMSDAESRVSVEIEGNEISFETGKLAKQASGAVVVRCGDTMVLCTATAGNLRDVDFLPL